MSRMLRIPRTARAASAPRPSRHFRTIASAVLGTAIVLSLTSAPAHAEPGVSATDRGLFGASDPTFDGVTRQSLAILGLHSAGVAVPPSALTWLLDQQCPDGSFAAFRSDPAAPCPPSDPASFTGPDTNSTSLAALALDALGEQAAADAAVGWLVDLQSPGGGWVWIPIGTPDAISTGLSLAAITAIGADGRSRISRSATNFLRRTEAGCEQDPSARFGMPFQQGLAPDTFSSSQSLLGLSGAFPVRQRTQRKAVPRPTCNSSDQVAEPAEGVARWLARSLNANDGALPNTYDPTSIDWNSTALTILGLVALRSAGIATDKAVAALQDNIEDYIGSDSGDRPAALGTSILVATATGTDPSDFGGADLTARLLASLQR